MSMHREERDDGISEDIEEFGMSGAQHEGQSVLRDEVEGCLGVNSRRSLQGTMRCLHIVSQSIGI